MHDNVVTMNERAILDKVQRWRRSRYSARPFVLTLLAVALISALAYSKNYHTTRQNARLYTTSSLSRRDIAILDQECRLVHQAQDQCAFVLANCPDEEAGVLSYLTLYYCRLPHVKPVAFVLITLWLALLFSTIGIAASDFFCVNLNTISRMLGMSESLAGVTLLAFGNGSPDVFSTFAAFRTHAASLAVGELIGAACFITAVVSGSMALIRPFAVARKSFVRDVGFFLAAAAFSMGFIADGKLHLWECLTMVAFYLFYVAFVVAWHWWMNLKKTRRAKAAAVRSHYITPGGDEEEFPEYHDEETTTGSGTSTRGVSIDDFSLLERGNRDVEGGIDDDDREEERDRWMGELTHNMRVSRPNMGSRRNTHTPIRPSLVGALEFRAVLSSLQKSRNIQSMPISLRRYSDDPTFTTAQQQDYFSSISDPAARPPFDISSIDADATPQLTRPNLEVQQHMGNRIRAVSTNDIDNVHLDPSTLGPVVPDITLGPATPDLRDGFPHPPNQTPRSPTISLSPPTSRTSSRAPSPAPPAFQQTVPNMLAPPGTDIHGNGIHGNGIMRSPNISPDTSPIMESGFRPQPPSLKLSVPGASSPPIPFPAYTEFPWSAQTSPRPRSLQIGSPSASPESEFPSDRFGAFLQTTPPRWWPSSILPTPRIFLSTLFPTLTNWQEKSVSDKILGVVASLPVFLLTITLPVVEPQKDDNNDGHAELSLDFGLPPSSPMNGSTDSRARSVSLVLPPESVQDMDLSKSKKGPNQYGHARGGSSMSTSAIRTPQVLITDNDNIAQSPEQLSTIPQPMEPAQWNRWLVIVQVFTAPLFIVLVLWANMGSGNPRTLVRHVLYSLLGSLCMLASILATTTPSRPPRWRSGLCFLGFVVAIAWISTIANEVVGVLRTLGVVLNMSDAILGLTIFAVGNSLGDLVADITVARLGFPIMALSACFGGPMLNILLGVGLSGCYMIITKGEHRHEKHPNDSVHFRPYHIAVSTTLVISGATLLVTLTGLLAGVPMRKWKMDKVIGWGLVALWSVSTFANVLVEVLGYSSNVS